MSHTASRWLIVAALLLAGAGCQMNAPSPAPVPEPMPEATTQEEPQAVMHTLNDFTQPPTEEPGLLVESELVPRDVLVTTSKGVIRLHLRGDLAPATVSNFLVLANTGFYDGLTFHRYEPGFVIQGGDPQGTGQGGPGYTIPAEIRPELLHDAYTVAMARLPDQVNPDRRSSGSQFYITLADASFLNGGYTTFGTVTEGMDVVDALRAGDTIQGIEILPLPEAPAESVPEEVVMPEPAS